jgi:hypothetical protein
VGRRLPVDALGPCGQADAGVAGTDDSVVMSEAFLGSASEYTRGKLAGPSFTHLSRDLYVVRDGGVRSLGDLDVRPRVEAVLALFPGEVVGHMTSLLLTNVPADDDKLVHLYRGRKDSRSTREGVMVHRVPIQDDEHRDVNGIQLVHGPTTLAHLAPDLTLEQLVGIGDVLANRYKEEDFQKALERAARRPGVELLRQVIPLLDKDSRSPAESRARLRLHAAGFTAMKHKVVIRDQAGGWLAESDLGDPVAKVALQHEGIIHFEKGIEQRIKDIGRDDLSRAEDWQIVNSTKIEDRYPDRLIAKTAAAYLRQAQLLGPHVLPEHLVETFHRRKAG